MPRRNSLFTQADITRMFKAALAAGFEKENIRSMKLTRDGAILQFGEEKNENKEDRGNEWDEVLHDDPKAAS